MKEFRDKSHWGPGPWQSEPDELAWKDERTGLACQIIRNMFTGQLNGYVGVPPTHPYHGWDYSDHIKLAPGDLEDSTINDVGIFDAFVYAFGGGRERGTIPLGMTMKAHSGITWSGGLAGGDDAESSGLWWFGFDCGHAGDVCPGLRAFDAWANEFMPPELARKLVEQSLDWKYRDLEYVRKEVTSLAFQLRQLETRVLLEESVLKLIGAK